MTNVFTAPTAANSIPPVQFLDAPIISVILVQRGRDGRPSYLIGNAETQQANALPTPSNFAPAIAPMQTEPPIEVKPAVKPPTPEPVTPKPAVKPPTPTVQTAPPTNMSREEMIAAIKRHIKASGGDARGLHLCKDSKIAEKYAALTNQPVSVTPTAPVQTAPPTPTAPVQTTTPSSFKGKPGSNNNNEIHPRPEWKAVVITKKGEGKEKTVFILQDSPEKMRVINSDGVDQTGVAAGYIRGFVWSVEKRHVKEVFHA